MSEETRNAETAPDDELVAYLDGELDEVESSRIEQRLSADTDYRLRLAQLQRSFDMLDSLPATDVDHSFTRSTVELVVLSESQGLSDTSLQQRNARTLGWMWVAACLMCAALASYIYVSSWMDRPNRKLVEDLPLIEDLDLYRYAESMDFLRKLDSQELFAEDRVDELQ